MSQGPEYTEVEKPLLDQLSGLGWQVIEGSKSDPCGHRAGVVPWLDP